MARLAFFLSLLGLGLGTFALFRMAEPKTCFHSNLVSKIVIRESDGNRHWDIPQCESLALGARPSPEPSWVEFAKTVIRKVETLDQLFSVMGRGPRLTLTLNVSEQLVWDQNESGLELGFGWAQAKGQLERALIS
jgi:hypothetical protein